jgi:hypothetical protein
MGFERQFWHTLVMIPTIPQPADAEPASESRCEPSVKPTHQPLPTEVIPEIGGRDGLDPTRYGDWELRGRCIDF